MKDRNWLQKVEGGRQGDLEVKLAPGENLRILRISLHSPSPSAWATLYLLSAGETYTLCHLNGRTRPSFEIDLRIPSPVNCTLKAKGNVVDLVGFVVVEPVSGGEGGRGTPASTPSDSAPTEDGKAKKGKAKGEKESGVQGGKKGATKAVPMEVDDGESDSSSEEEEESEEAFDAELAKIMAQRARENNISLSQIRKMVGDTEEDDELAEFAKQVKSGKVDIPDL